MTQLLCSIGHACFGLFSEGGPGITVVGFDDRTLDNNYANGDTALYESVDYVPHQQRYEFGDGEIDRSGDYKGGASSQLSLERAVLPNDDTRDYIVDQYNYRSNGDDVNEEQQQEPLVDSGTTTVSSLDLFLFNPDIEIGRVAAATTSTSTGAPFTNDCLVEPLAGYENITCTFEEHG